MGKIEVEYRHDAIFDRALELVECQDEWPDRSPQEMLSQLVNHSVGDDQDYMALRVFFRFMCLTGWPVMPPKEFVAHMRRAKLLEQFKRSTTCLLN